MRDIEQMTHIVPKTCFESPLGDVLKTSWVCPEPTSQGRSLDVRLGCPLNVISGRPEDLEEGILGTSWGPIFVGWVNTYMFFYIFHLLDHYDLFLLKDNFLFHLFFLNLKSTLVLFCHSIYSHLEKINWYNLTNLSLQVYILWKRYNKIHT